MCSLYLILPSNDNITINIKRGWKDLLQLFLHHPLLLRDVFQLLSVLLRKVPACLLRGPLLGRQRLLGLPVGSDLLLQELLLHLEQLLGVEEPLLVLVLLGVI